MNSLQGLPLFPLIIYTFDWHICAFGTYVKEVWSIFQTSESGISWHNTAADMAVWKVNFSSTTKWGEGSTLPVVPLCLLQFNWVRIPFPHRSVNYTVPTNSIRMSGLFALITPLPIFKICLLLMSPPACRIPVAMFLTFRIRWSSKIFGSTQRKRKPWWWSLRYYNWKINISLNYV